MANQLKDFMRLPVTTSCFTQTKALHTAVNVVTVKQSLKMRF